MRIAWDSLRWFVGGRVGAFGFDGYAITPRLEMVWASFVTLHRGGMLRGCIGALVAEGPIYRSVHANAVKAASRDPRFEALGAEELAGLEVSVSILSPVEVIPSLAEFRVGEQGLILEKDGKGSVFLPEVAVEQGWGREETVAQLCRKAGLPVEAWREGAVFKVFSSAVLSRA